MRRTRPLSPRTTSCNNRGPPRHPRRRHRRQCARVAEQSQSRSRKRRPPPGGAGGGANHRSGHPRSRLEDCHTARPERPATCRRGSDLAPDVALRPLDPLVVPSLETLVPVTLSVARRTAGTVCGDSNLRARRQSRDGDSVSCVLSSFSLELVICLGSAWAVAHVGATGK